MAVMIAIDQCLAQLPKIIGGHADVRGIEPKDVTMCTSDDDILKLPNGGERISSVLCGHIVLLYGVGNFCFGP